MYGFYWQLCGPLATCCITGGTDREGFSGEFGKPDLLDIPGEQIVADDPNIPEFEGNHRSPSLSTQKYFEQDDGHDRMSGVSGMWKEDKPFQSEVQEGDKT